MRARGSKPISPRGFDPGALYLAILAQKQERGLSWAAVAREMWDEADVLHASADGHDHPIASSTIRGVEHGDASCQHALVMLRWLGRPPEDFIATPRPETVGFPLPEPGPEFMIRWDLRATYAALDEARMARGATWAQAASALHCSPGELTGLRTAKYGASMRLMMRIAQALRRPAASFVIASRH